MTSLLGRERTHTRHEKIAKKRFSLNSHREEQKVKLMLFWMRWKFAYYLTFILDIYDFKFIIHSPLLSSEKGKREIFSSRWRASHSTSSSFFPTPRERKCVVLASLVVSFPPFILYLGFFSSPLSHHQWGIIKTEKSEREREAISHRKAKGLRAKWGRETSSLTVTFLLHRRRDRQHGRNDTHMMYCWCLLVDLHFTRSETRREWRKIIFVF